jgi:hypothetical protein
VTWKERRFFLGDKNPYQSVIIQIFNCPLLVQKIGCLVRYPRTIFSQQQNFENKHKSIKNLIKIVGGLVLPQGPVQNVTRSNSQLTFFDRDSYGN